MCKENCEEKCCSAEGKSCCCSEKGCDCGGEHSEHATMIMQLANEAWTELLKEKMKSAFEKALGDKLNKVAQVGVEASTGYWQNKMKVGIACAEFEEKLKKAMM